MTKFGLEIESAVGLTLEGSPIITFLNRKVQEISKEEKSMADRLKEARTHISKRFAEIAKSGVFA